MLPKKGRKLPAWEGALGGREAYADVMADLLRKEHGDSHRAVKQLMRQTDASERTVKHWLAAQHGPDTVFFLRLIATSPVIRAFVLGVIESPVVGRQSFTPGRWAHDEAMIDARSASAMQRVPPENDPINDPDRDPGNDPITDGLNERQRWFLDRVGKGFRSGARDISYRWEVSPKTARRDIAGLRLIGRLQFVGARRNGHYQLVEDEDAQPPAH
jgi:hypothetical protein